MKFRLHLILPLLKVKIFFLTIYIFVEGALVCLRIIVLILLLDPEDSDRHHERNGNERISTYLPVQRDKVNLTPGVKFLPSVHFIT